MASLRVTENPRDGIKKAEAGQFSLLSALNTLSSFMHHGCILGLPCLWGRAVPHVTSVEAGSPPVLGAAQMGDKKTPPASRHWDTKQGTRDSRWIPADGGSVRRHWDVIWQVAGSHLSGPKAPGAQARARGEEGLGSSREEGFQSCLINPANMTDTLRCLLPSPFLPFQLSFTSLWQRAGGRDVLGS